MKGRCKHWISWNEPCELGYRIISRSQCMQDHNCDAREEDD